MNAPVSDTPRTDDVSLYTTGDDLLNEKPLDHQFAEIVPSHFARTLERELQQARQGEERLREALEATPCGCKYYPEDDPDTDVKHECARCAALEGRTAVPEGFVLVPKEPTMEMMVEGGSVFDSFARDFRLAYHLRAEMVYRAMLSAAPQTKEET